MKKPILICIAGGSASGKTTLVNEIAETFSNQEKKALSFCTEIADTMKVKIYLVGGIVRDILLKRSYNDIDICLRMTQSFLASVWSKDILTKLKF